MKRRHLRRRWFAFWWDTMLERWSSYMADQHRRDALSTARDLRRRGFRARVGWETLE